MASKLLGPDGQPIDKASLFGEPQAGPTRFSFRNPVSGHPADSMDPARLAQIHRAAVNGSPRQYLELAEDIEEREPQYLTVLSTRRRAVAQLPITITPASDDREHQKHAALIRDWVSDGMLELALFDILDAISKGFSVTEIEWDVKTHLPKALDHRPARWFTFSQDDGETILLDGIGKQALSPHKFIVHRHKAKSGLTIRGGLARAVSWSWMFKSFTAKDWAIFVQNYGQPVRLGRYDGTSSEADREILWNAVASIGGDLAAIIPKSMEIEFVRHDAAKDTADLYLARVKYFDEVISKLVLGQTTTTDAISGGHAVSQEHRLVQEDIERADAKLLSATLTTQLVHSIIAFNFGPQEKYPRLMIGRPDELPIEKFIDGVDKMAARGLKVKSEEVRQRLGLSKPEPDDEVIGAASAPAAPANAARDGLNLARHMISLHASAPEPAYVNALTAALAEDAAAAMAGLTGEIEKAFAEASDLNDLAARLARLELDPEALAEAMGRGMALANLTGRAALMAEISGRDKG